MNSAQNHAQTRTLIGVDEELINELRTILHATKLELTKIQQQGKEPMTLKQSAAYLHVSYPTLKDYIDKGQITPSEYGNRVWIIRNELDAFISRNRRKHRR